MPFLNFTFFPNDMSEENRGLDISTHMCINALLKGHSFPVHSGQHMEIHQPPPNEKAHQNLNTLKLADKFTNKTLLSPLKAFLCIFSISYFWWWNIFVNKWSLVDTQTHWCHFSLPRLHSQIL